MQLRITPGSALQLEVERLRATAYGDRQQVVDLQQMGRGAAAPGERIAITAASSVALPDVAPDRRRLARTHPWRRHSRIAWMRRYAPRATSGSKTCVNPYARFSATGLCEPGIDLLFDLVYAVVRMVRAKPLSIVSGGACREAWHRLS